MERLSERLTAIEAVLKKLEPVEGLLWSVWLYWKIPFTRPRKSLHFSRGVHVYRRVRKYVVQTHIEQGNPALQTSRQDALLREEGRAGRMALAKTTNLRWTMPCVWRRKYPQPNRSLTRSAMENEKRTDRNSWAELDENRLSDILTASQIKATDTYVTPPQIIWIDNSTIATLGNFSASTGKAKAKKKRRLMSLLLSLRHWRAGRF